MKGCLVLISVFSIAFAKVNGEKPAGKDSRVFVCSAKETKPTPDWIDIKESCVSVAQQQIRMEFKAALAYLQLGSHFSRYDINRPGFAKFFFNAASEERSHAIKIFDYLLMRGQLTEQQHQLNLTTLLTGDLPKMSVIESGLSALTKSLKLEVSVTRSIKEMIKVCENDSNVIEKDGSHVAANDYHMVDWLITDLLDEQLKGQRELAGRISTLSKMESSYGKMSEFLYDKTLLGELESKAA